MRPRFLSHIQIMLQGVGNTLHAGTHHVPLRFREIKPVEHTLRVRIPDRRALSAHIREKNKSVRSGRNLFRLMIQLHERRLSGLLRQETLLSGELPLKPPHHSAASGRTALQQPFARNDMKRQNQPGIRLIFIQADAHAAGLSSLLLCIPVVNHAGAKRSARGIKTSRNYRRSLQKSRFLRRCLCHLTDHLITVHDLRQELLRDSDLGCHIIIPDTPSHIKAMPAVRVTDIFRYLSGQTISDVSVRVQNLVRVCIDLRKVFSVPENLRRGVGRLQRVSCKIKNSVLSDPFIDTVTHRLRAGIHPDRRIRQILPVLIQSDGGPALPVDSDSTDIRRLHLPLSPDLCQCLTDAPVPVLRILLRPARVRIINRIITRRGCLHPAVPVKGRHLAGARSDIYSQ